MTGQCAACGKALEDGACPSCSAMGATLPRSRAPRPAQAVVGERYRLGRLLGQGSFGRVHEGEDVRLRRKVAIKVLHSDVEAGDVKREGRALARLQHPNIVSVHDMVIEPGALALVMELVPGTTLAARLTAGPMPWREAARIGADVAAGLQHAHERGVVHGDVKASNVLLADSGVVKVSDFGTARFAESISSHRGDFAGTVALAAPEVLDGRKPDARSDVYSLGCLLFQALSGSQPFLGETQAAVVRAIQDEPAPSLQERGVSVPAALEALVASCLAKRADARPASAAAVGLALGALLGESKAPEGAAVPAELRAGAVASAATGERRRTILLALQRRHLEELAEEWAPERVRRLRDAELQTILAVAREHGALLEGEAGDATRLAFGLLGRSDRDGRTAATCAAELLRRLREAAHEGSSPSLAAALHVVRATAPEPDRPWALPLRGRQEAEAILARAGESEVLASRAFVDAARDACEFEPAGTTESVRGAPPLELFKLVGTARREPASGRLVGRGPEMTLLLQAAERAESQPVLVTLQGPPGIGKSRLLDELAAELRDRGCFVARAEAPDVHLASPGHPFPALLAELHRAPGFAEALDRLPDAERLALACQESGRWERPEVAAFSPQERQAVLRVAWSLLLASLTTTSPVALLVDDAHWLEPRTVAALAALTEGAEARLLVVLARRPEGFTGSAPRPRDVTLTLGPLTSRHVQELVADCLGSEASAEVARLVQERAEGVPLLALELARHLRESGRLRQGDGLVGVGGEEASGWPASLEAIVTSRVDRLAPAERLLLQAGAVLGRDFDLSAAALALDEAAAFGEADALIEGPVQRGLVERIVRGGREQVRFAHALIRDVVYDGLVASRRRTLHGAAARACEAAAVATGHELEDLVAHHLAEAGRPLESAARLEASAALLRVAGEPRAALKRMSEALLLRRGAGQAGALVLGARVIDAVELVQEEEDRAEPWWVAVLQECCRNEDRALQFRAGYLLARGEHIAGRPQQALAMLDGLLDPIRNGTDVGDADTLARAWAMKSLILGNLARHAESRAALDAVDRDRPLAPKTHLILVHQRMRTDFNSGDHSRALASIEEGLRLADHMEDPCARTRLLAQRTTVLMVMGRLAEAEAVGEECLANSRRLGLLLTESYCSSALAQRALDACDINRALELGRRAVALADQVGRPFNRSQALRALAEAHSRLGDHASAGSIAATALELARRSASKPLTAGASLVAAKVEVGSGNALRGVLPATEALELSRSLGDHLREGRSRAVLAECLRECGRLDDAEEVLRPGLELPERLRRPVVVEWARTLAARKRPAEALERLRELNPGGEADDIALLARLVQAECTVVFDAAGGRTLARAVLQDAERAGWQGVAGRAEKLVRHATSDHPRK